MSAPDIVIARRVLQSRTKEGNQPIEVKVFAPNGDGENWLCAYEIGWPDAARRNVVHGVDSAQALVLAIQMLGAELYAGRPVKILELNWLGDDGSVGFPLPPSLRDVARGDDRLI